MKKVLYYILLIMLLTISATLVGCEKAGDTANKKSAKERDKEPEDDVIEYKYDDDNIMGLKKIVLMEDSVEFWFDRRKADEGYIGWALRDIAEEGEDCDEAILLKDKNGDSLTPIPKCKSSIGKYVLSAPLEEDFVPDYLSIRDGEIDGFEYPILFYRLWGGECADTYKQQYSKNGWSKVETQFESYPLTDGADDIEPIEEDSPIYATNAAELLTEQWQYIYKEVLDGYRGDRECAHEILSGDPEDIYGYFLCRINDDEIPELIVRLGSCEADYHDEVYTVLDNELTLLGELPGGHTSYYNTPNDGTLSVWGHMGCMAVYKIECDKKGNLSMESIFEEDINDDPELVYTPITDIVPGAVYANSYCYCLDLPLAGYMSSKILTADLDIDNDEVRDIIENVVFNNGVIRPYQIEHFREPLTPMSFNTFLEGGNIDQWSDDTDEVETCEFIDINMDGQDEAVITTVNDKVVILNYQNGKVYAYFYEYRTATDLQSIEDGCFTFSAYESITEAYLIFCADQVYEEAMYN